MTAAHAHRLSDALIKTAMRRSLVTDWGIQQGMHITGTHSPAAFLEGTRQYRTDDISSSVTQDVLLLGGAEDHYVPVGQFAEQVRLLTAARSVTARLFTSADSAQNHVHIRNIGLSLTVVADWLESFTAPRTAHTNENQKEQRGLSPGMAGRTYPNNG